MTTNYLLDIIEQAKRSHDWMLETIRGKEDETDGGNYSDDLKHAINVQKLLDMTGE